jgi:hypothetical protein
MVYGCIRRDELGNTAGRMMMRDTNNQRRG